MFYQKYKEQALADLDIAHKEYDRLVQETTDLFDELNALKDGSFTLITDVEGFVASIRKGPFTFTKELIKIKKQKEKFQKSEEIKRKERKEKMASGAGAVAALGLAGAAAVTFWDFIDAKLGNKLKNVFGKNILVSLVVAVLVFVFLLIFLIGWTISNHRAGKKAEKLIEQIKTKTKELQDESVAADALIKIMKDQYRIVGQRLEELSVFFGMKRKELTDEQYADVKTLVHDTVGLSELLNQ